MGTSFSELDTAGWDSAALLNDRLIHIASSVSSFDRSPMAYLHVYGNLRALFGQLVAGLDARYIAYRNHDPMGRREEDKQSLTRITQSLVPPSIEVWEQEKCLSDDLPIKPQRLMLELVKKCSPQSSFVIDTGNAWSWGTHYMHLKAAGSFHIAMGFGAMGWAIGAAVGIAFARPSAPVVCVTGDGAYLMSGQELSVAVQQRQRIVYIVLNDAALGMVKHGQRMNQAEEIGVELPLVDFAAIAAAQGAAAYSVKSWEDFEFIPEQAWLCEAGPVLIDVQIDGEEIPPMQSRLDVLQVAKHGVNLTDLEASL